MRRVLLLPLLLLPVSACEEEKQAAAENPVRAIKYMKLDKRAGVQERRIAGQVAAENTSNVAFETSGRVVALLRRAGDPVKKGDLIARLDPEPFKIQVGQKQAELDAAEAKAADARKKYAQQKQLLERGYTTRTAYDTAEANMKSAEGAVASAQKVLDRARRDLEKTDLKAPLAGVIATRSVDLFEEVAGGKPIYSIQTATGGKIEAALPETLVNRVSLGARVTVSFPPLGGAAVTGKIDEVAPLTGDANAYPIKVSLDKVPPGMRPGMSAELIFRFATQATGKAFLVPFGAVRPSVRGSHEATVFIYDPKTGKLSEHPVNIANVEGNKLQIVGKLDAGSIIAIAGVSFLHDGMVVKLLDQSRSR